MLFQTSRPDCWKARAGGPFSGAALIVLLWFSVPPSAQKRARGYGRAWSRPARGEPQCEDLRHGVFSRKRNEISLLALARRDGGAEPFLRVAHKRNAIFKKTYHPAKHIYMNVAVIIRHNRQFYVYRSPDSVSWPPTLKEIVRKL